MINVPYLIEWIISDMRVEAQLDLEDMELVRLGVPLHDAQAMPLYQRQSYIKAGGIVTTWAQFAERRRLMDVGIMTSGYVERGPKSDIQDRWQKDLRSHIDTLSDFSLEARSTIMAPPPAKKRKFIDVLRGIKKDG